MKKISIYILVLSLLLVLPFGIHALAEKKACPQCGHLTMSETLVQTWVYKWDGSSHYYNKTYHQTCSHCTYDKNVTRQLSGSHAKASSYTVGNFVDRIDSQYHHTVYMKFYDCKEEGNGCGHRFPGETWYGSPVRHTFTTTVETKNGLPWRIKKRCTSGCGEVSYTYLR